MSSGQYDQETLDKWLDEDLARIHDETLWKEQKKGKVGDHEAVCFVHKQKDDSFWWFKIVASMPDATLAQARCLPPPPSALTRSFRTFKANLTPLSAPPPTAATCSMPRSWRGRGSGTTSSRYEPPFHFPLFVAFALFRSFFIFNSN
jgi:hypothetical protein